MKRWRVIVIFILGIVLFIWFLIRINYRELWKALCNAKLGWVFASLAIGLAGYYIRAIRWQYLLLPIKKIAPFKLFKATVIGFSVTIVLPGRIGEIVRPYLIGAWEDISKSSALATIVLERIIDMLCVLTYFALYLAFFMDRGSTSTFQMLIRKSSIIAFMIGISGFIILFIWGNKPQVFKKIIMYILFWGSERIKQKAVNVVESFSSGLGILRQPWLLLKVVVLSFIFWFMICVSTSFIIWAFMPGIAFIHGIFIMGLLVAGIAIPTPGGVGTFHLLVRNGLIWLNVDANVASAIALLYHLISVGPPLIMGILFMWYEGLKWEKIKNMVPGSPVSQ